MIKLRPINYTVFCIVLMLCFGCKPNKTVSKIPEVVATSAMKNVMWKGELFGKIQLDTLPKKGLYGLGPQDYLQGELLINDGVVYVSKVVSDSTMIVLKKDKVSAPFFVHSYVEDWSVEALPNTVSSISDLETYLKTKTTKINVPFAFKLEGTVNSAEIHIQNLPEGAKVSSPKEAHQGQVNYTLLNEDVVIIGFYSEHHHGIFTHHDSNVHLHLMTKDEEKMGHLDAIAFKEMRLYLPKELNL